MVDNEKDKVYYHVGPNAWWAGFWKGECIGLKYLNSDNIVDPDVMIKMKRAKGLSKDDNPDDFEDFNK